MSFKARRLRRCSAAFWKPVVPDGIVGLTQLRDMTIMSEYGVDRWRERDLDAGFRYPTECGYAGSSNIIDAVFIRSGGDADRRLGEFMINVSVKARHESLPLPCYALHFRIRYMFV